MTAHAAASIDLSALESEQASSLEQIAGEALIGFGLRRAELRGRSRQAAPQGRYAADTAGEIAQVRRLEAMARRFLAAAHARSLAAERERCLAVRTLAAAEPDKADTMHVRTRAICRLPATGASLLGRALDVHSGEEARNCARQP